MSRNTGSPLITAFAAAIAVVLLLIGVLAFIEPFEKRVSDAATEIPPVVVETTPTEPSATPAPQVNPTTE